MKLSIEEYLVTNNSKAIGAILSKYNIPSPKSPSDMVRKLRFVMKNHKETITDDLRNVNTDYKALILSGIKPVESKSNACGCSGADGSTSNASGAVGEVSSNCDGASCKCGSEKSNIRGKSDWKDYKNDTRSNADGDQTPATTTPSKVDKTISDFNKFVPALIGGSLFVIAIAMIVKK